VLNIILSNAFWMREMRYIWGRSSQKIETLWGKWGARKFVKYCPKGRKYSEILSLQSADKNMWLLEKVCKSGVEKSTKREKFIIHIPPRIIRIMKLRIMVCVRHVACMRNWVFGSEVFNEKDNPEDSGVNKEWH